MSARILLVGLGNRGRTWGRILAAHPDVTLAGIVDVDPARVDAFHRDIAPAPVFAGLAAGLAGARPDAVVLVTPPDGHRAQADAIFAAGVPLLSEKPLTLDLAEAVAIVRAGEAAKVPLAVGLNFRYLAVSQAIRDLVARQVFGAPNFGVFNYLRNRDWWRPGMNTYPRQMRHPMMLEQSIHHLDLIRYCYGAEVAHVTCRSWNPPWSVYADDANVACHLTMTNGMEVAYVGTWTGGWNEMGFQWRTDAPEGVILQRELFGDLVTARTEDKAPTPVDLAPCEPFIDDTRGLLDAFLAALAKGEPVPCSGRDHLRSLALCFAAIEADASGSRVDVAAFERRHGVA